MVIMTLTHSTHVEPVFVTLERKDTFFRGFRRDIAREMDIGVGSLQPVRVKVSLQPNRVEV